MTSSGFALAKSRRPLAASTTSPSTNAIADGPASSDESWSTSPASVTAILVRVFLTTVNVALSASDRRSSASWATVSPRYSVSTAPVESAEPLGELGDRGDLLGVSHVPPLRCRRELSYC